MSNTKGSTPTLRQHLETAQVKRADLFADDTRRKHITFHDLRATGITWMAVAGEDPLRIKQRAGHQSFSTTEGYIREAENLRAGFGEPSRRCRLRCFSPTSGPTGGYGCRNLLRFRLVTLWSKGGSNTFESAPNSDGGGAREAEKDAAPSPSLSEHGEEVSAPGEPVEPEPRPPAEPSPADPDAALKGAIGAAVAAGDLARARALLDVLEASPRPATVLTLARPRGRA